MSIVEKFTVSEEKVDRHRQTTVHKATLKIDKGQGFIRIDAYGTKMRKFPHQPSQTLVLERNTVKTLVETIKKKFL